MSCKLGRASGEILHMQSRKCSIPPQHSLFQDGGRSNYILSSCAIRCPSMGMQRSRRRLPEPQNAPRLSPESDMMTTERAAGTAWEVPRNWEARSMARVELCMPPQRERVRQVRSSHLRGKEGGSNGSRGREGHWRSRHCAKHPCTKHS